MLCRVALGTQIVEQRINSEVQIKVLLKSMNNPLGVSPSKGKQATTRGKEKNLLTMTFLLYIYIYRLKKASGRTTSDDLKN